MALANLTPTSTFRQWYTLTNDMVDTLTLKVIGDSLDVYGTYKVKQASNTSVDLCGGLKVNDASVLVNTAMTVGANVVITSLANVFSVTSNTISFQPLNGTLIQTPITINAASSFLKTVTIGANVSITGNLATTGESTFTGPVTVKSGALHIRQTLYSQTGATISNTMSSPIFNDFAPTGIGEAEIVNLTPTINCAVTGIASPSVGARILYIQNLSPTYYISLQSSNTSSQSENRIVSPGNANTDLAPGSAVALIYTKTNNTWRVLSPPASSTSPFASDVHITGRLTVDGISTFVSPITVSSSSQSYIPNLRTGTFQNDSGATFSAATSFAGTSTFNGGAVFNSSLTAASGAFTSLSATNTITGSVSGSAATAGYASSAGSVPATGVGAGTAGISITGSASTVTTAAQPNITSLGTLTGLTVTGTTKLLGRCVIPVGTNMWATT